MHTYVIACPDANETRLDSLYVLLGPAFDSVFARQVKEGDKLSK
jgi:hypothetical protein